MNRSILIVICDFLLVSLLAFSTVDINKATQGGQPNFRMKTPSETPEGGQGSQAETDKDLAAVMRLALDEERQHREQLLSELARSRNTASQREQELQTYQEQLQAREELARQLEAQQTRLQEQVQTAKVNIQKLNEQLQTRSTEAVISREKLAAMEAEARKNSERAAALERQLADLSASNQMVLSEKQRLFTELRVAEAEKRSATEQVARMTEQVQAERMEKAKLVENVSALATKSTQLAQEIRDNRPLAPNTIFNQFVTNRVTARFNAVKKGLFGSNRRNDTETILVTDGTNTYALCHVQDTPLALWDPGMDWDGLTGQLSRQWATLPIRSLYFSGKDPRLVWMPITAEEVRELGSKAYPVSANPFNFQEAVIVGTQEPYYGECRFEIDVSTPGYVKLDRSFVRGLFGKFNPSRGDLVFSRTGELLGIMANDAYCLMIPGFDATARFEFGNDVRAQRTGIVLSQLYWQLAQLPSKLQ